MYLPKKRVFRVASLALCVLMIVAQNPATVDSTSLMPVDIGSSAVTYITNGSDGYLVGDIWSGYLVLEKLKENRVRRLDAIFVEKMDLQTAVQMQVLGALYSDFTVYFPSSEAPGPSSDQWREIKNKLSSINYIVFDCADSVGTSVVRLVEEGNLSDEKGSCIEAVFINGSFSAYGFKKFGLESEVSVLMPKMYFRYDRFSGIEDYNIIRAYYYRDAGSKLYLIGEEYDKRGVYSLMASEYIYNYKTYKFY